MTLVTHLQEEREERGLCGPHAGPRLARPWGSTAPRWPRRPGVLAQLRPCWPCDPGASSDPEPVRPGAGGGAAFWVKPLQRVELFVQRPGRLHARPSETPLPGSPFTERGGGRGPSLVKAWVGFLLSPAPETTCLLCFKNRCEHLPFPFCEWSIHISCPFYFFSIFYFFLLLSFRKFPSC